MAGKTGSELVARPRLEWIPKIEERFGVDQSSWRALIDAVFPAAQSTDSVVLALSYCRARNLDPFKRPVHIVPMWSSAARRMIDTIWPGIGEYRTTAFRTKQYAGSDPTSFGPLVEKTFEGTVKVGKDKTQKKKVTVTFPEWAQKTVHRLVQGERVAFAGPTVYWLETYGKQQNTKLPNAMWEQRPSGQIEKCAEAAALRMAFPEVGEDPTAEEMEGHEYRGPAHAKDMGEAVEVAAAPRPQKQDYEAQAQEMDSAYEAAVGDQQKPEVQKEAASGKKKEKPPADEKPEAVGEEPEFDGDPKPDVEPTDWWQWASDNAYKRLAACKTLGDVDKLAKSLAGEMKKCAEEAPAASDAVKVEFNKRRANIKAEAGDA